MPIEFACPACCERMRVEDAEAGREVRCGVCRASVRVPETRSAPAAEVMKEPPPVPGGAGERHSSHHRPGDRRSAERRAPRPGGHRDRPAGRHPVSRGPLSRVVVMVVAALAFVALLFGAVAGVGYFFFTTPKWWVHQSGGGFKVALPAPARSVSEMSGANGQPAPAGVGAVLRGDGEVYTATYLDAPPERSDLSDEQLLADAVARVVGGPGRRMVSEQPIEVDGFPGREVVVGEAEGGTSVVRLVVAGGREYCLSVDGRSVGPGASGSGGSWIRSRSPTRGGWRCPRSGGRPRRPRPSSGD